MNLILKYSKQIEDLSKLDGVYGVYIFGSNIYGKVKPISDIDVCFFVDNNNYDLINKLYSYKTDQFDINIFHKLPIHIQFKILKDGKKFVINNREKFREQKLKYLKKYLEEGKLLKKFIKKRYGVEV